MVMEEIKKQRGRPKKDPSQLKPKKLSNGGKRGRPKRDTPKEEVITYNSSPQAMKIELGKTFLEMQGGDVTKEQKKKYFEVISNTPVENFSSSGFGLFRGILNKIKNETIQKDNQDTI